MNKRIAKEIRDYYWRTGGTFQDVAESFGVSKSVINDILNNRTHKDDGYIRPNKITETRLKGIPQEVYDLVEKIRKNNYKMVE